MNTDNQEQAQALELLELINSYSKEKTDEYESDFHLLNDYSKQEIDNAKCNFNLAADVSKIIEKSDKKQPYQINIFDYVGGIEEPSTSYFLKEILNYSNDGNYEIAKSFANAFLVPLGFNTSWIDKPNISCETYNIDILLDEEKKYAVVIENKLKGAVFQRNQLARYIATLRRNGYEENQIFLVILPDKKENYESHIHPSTWRLPPDWLKPNQERACRYYDGTLCRCDCNMPPIPECSQCKTDIKDRYAKHTIILYGELSNWLETKAIKLIPESESLLKSVAFQFADYLNGIYKNRLNDKLIMTIENFLREKLVDTNAPKIKQFYSVLEKLKELERLQVDLGRLRDSLSESVIHEWYNNLKPKWGKKVIEGDNNFKAYIHGVQCGCWPCDDGKPVWGFYDSDPTDEQKDIVEKVIERAKIDIPNIGEYKPYRGYIELAFTEEGDKICDAFYNAAKELDYLD